MDERVWVDVRGCGCIREGVSRGAGGPGTGLLYQSNNPWVNERMWVVERVGMRG